MRTHRSNRGRRPGPSNSNFNYNVIIVDNGNEVFAVDLRPTADFNSSHVHHLSEERLRRIRSGRCYHSNENLNPPPPPQPIIPTTPFQQQSSQNDGNQYAPISMPPSILPTEQIHQQIYQNNDYQNALPFTPNINTTLDEASEGTTSDRLVSSYIPQITLREDQNQQNSFEPIINTMDLIFDNFFALNLDDDSISFDPNNQFSLDELDPFTFNF